MLTTKDSKAKQFKGIQRKLETFSIFHLLCANIFLSNKMLFFYILILTTTSIVSAANNTTAAGSSSWPGCYTIGSDYEGDDVIEGLRFSPDDCANWCANVGAR
jgi:hypothetical protein